MCACSIRQTHGQMTANVILPSLLTTASLLHMQSLPGDSLLVGWGWGGFTECCLVTHFSVSISNNASKMESPVIAWTCTVSAWKRDATCRDRVTDQGLRKVHNKNDVT